ncbi:hydrolase, NUDIX family [Teladorsagia circumcincta]|uniref:Hydrolase, NUDIX family n=1 Tax=Teladorsagia circumcincta TaxID=45464 RepID=A0A2G9U714_TELCI|nr:hydrolase, NUDIX family [Teladorsagia circumcincta]
MLRSQGVHQSSLLDIITVDLVVLEAPNVVSRDADNLLSTLFGELVCASGPRRGKDAMVLLVSGGKEGGKWVIPGGGIEQNECAEEAARRELEEEAGVKARAVEVIGLFQDDDRKHRTTVFLMEVVEELSVWQEGEHGRRRIWLPLNVGAEVVKVAHRPILNAVLAR